VSDQGVIRAAGGVLWRPKADGVEVVLVHRDRYDDWTLPKGKLDAGESHKVAALREVLEETGFSCRLGRKLATTVYDTPIGPKRVKWWAMQPCEGQGDGDGPENPAEISALEWLAFEDAWHRLTYRVDRDVLSAFAERVLGYVAQR
jgi:8-oxo-dGTP pyrophosphatase MutT (NUDIX family)